MYLPLVMAVFYREKNKISFYILMLPRDIVISTITIALMKTFFVATHKYPYENIIIVIK
jgi:hypothetical protein